MFELGVSLSILGIMLVLLVRTIWKVHLKPVLWYCTECKHHEIARMMPNWVRDGDLQLCHLRWVPKYLYNYDIGNYRYCGMVKYSTRPASSTQTTNKDLHDLNTWINEQLGGKR